MDRNLPSIVVLALPTGQARKSLWIETFYIFTHVTPARPVRLVRACGSKRWHHIQDEMTIKVRLVRACGSKHFHNLKFDGNFWVRLVRACGSKHSIREIGAIIMGQARKSLWIETDNVDIDSSGKARSGS